MNAFEENKNQQTGLASLLMRPSSIVTNKAAIANPQTFDPVREQEKAEQVLYSHSFIHSFFHSLYFRQKLIYSRLL